MNNRSSDSSIDWLELDRLVDGRLDGDEYRELLCQIDADPDGWRHCALAFLEHQALVRELSAFAGDPTSNLLASVAPVAPTEQAAEPVDLARKSVANPNRKSESTSTGAVIGWISMALCVAFGLALGITLQSDLHERLEVGPPMQQVTIPFVDEKPADEILKSENADQSMASQKASEMNGVSSVVPKCDRINRCNHRSTLQNRKSKQRNFDGIRD